MKKIITAAAFLIFGTILMTAQTTKDSTTKLPQKSDGKEMRSTTTAQQNSKNKMIDTANLEQRQKTEDEKVIKRSESQRDGLNNEASKPLQPHPIPGQTE